MFRSHIFGDGCTPRRWLLAGALVASTLVIGGTGLSVPVARADGSTTTKYLMVATRTAGNSTICVGDDVPIRVRVTRALFVGNQADQPEDIPGVLVQAALSNPSVGKLNPVTFQTGWIPNDPGAILFNVRALTVGSTTVSFKGTIKQMWWGRSSGFVSCSAGTSSRPRSTSRSTTAATR